MGFHVPKELKTITKLFTDEMSLFTIAKDANESANAINNGLDLKLCFQLEIAIQYGSQQISSRNVVLKKKEI